MFDCSFLCITIRVYPIAGVHTVHGNTISGRARAKTWQAQTAYLIAIDSLPSEVRHIVQGKQLDLKRRQDTYIQF